MSVSLSPPSSLPNYLADGLPKQDLETLRDIQQFVEALIHLAERDVEAAELPDGDEVVDDAASGRGTVVKERVKCGTDCTCNDGAGHGPYLYAYRWEDGKLVSEYLGKPGSVG